MGSLRNYSDTAHLILSSSPTLANPFQNPFHFSRISLLYFDLNAQDLPMRPEGGNPPQISPPICLHSPQGLLLPPPLLRFLISFPGSLSQMVPYTFPYTLTPHLQMTSSQFLQFLPCCFPNFF